MDRTTIKSETARAMLEDQRGQEEKYKAVYLKYQEELAKMRPEDREMFDYTFGMPSVGPMFCEASRAILGEDVCALAEARCIADIEAQEVQKVVDALPAGSPDERRALASGRLRKKMHKKKIAALKAQGQ
jgi:hypothetical protein